MGDPEVDDWILYLPQVTTKRMAWQVAGLTFASVERSRVDNAGRFKAFTEPRHRRVAAVLTGQADGTLVDPSARALLADARRGALVLYPVYPFRDAEPDWPEIPAMGFAFLPPVNTHPRRLVWGLRDRRQAAEPIINWNSLLGVGTRGADLSGHPVSGHLELHLADRGEHRRRLPATVRAQHLGNTLLLQLLDPAAKLLVLTRINIAGHREMLREKLGIGGYFTGTSRYSVSPGRSADAVVGAHIAERTRTGRVAAGWEGRLFDLFWPTVRA